MMPKEETDREIFGKLPKVLKLQIIEFRSRGDVCGINCRVYPSCDSRESSLCLCYIWSTLGRAWVRLYPWGIGVLYERSNRHRFFGVCPRKRMSQ